MQKTENSILSYASRLTTNSEDRTYYLKNTITDYLTKVGFVF